MSEWRKITWGDITTMPADGIRVEAHRKLPGKNDADERVAKCWYMRGETRWHVPLLVPREGIFSSDHTPAVQVSLVHAAYEGPCVDPDCEQERPPDQQFGIILDTLWWRERS